MKVVFIEGPGKRESIQKYLGPQYKVIPTLGHIRDLPLKDLGVDIAKNFAPEYVILPDKKKTVQHIIEEAKKADGVLLATDPDREGEAIAWHVANVLGLDQKEPVRIVFNEISKTAVNRGLNEARAIDLNLVDAQQARRVLDRLVGYKLSPLLCRKIQSNLSAGRVQSVTLRLLVDREREIENFKPEEYWTLSAELKKDGFKDKVKCYLVAGKDKKVNSKEEMDKILAEVKGVEFEAVSVKKSVTSSHPSAPFTTSTMQQDALNKLGMSLKQTTSTAQTLYEGVDVAGEGKVALVTYIRTDSVRISPEAQAKAKEYIEHKFGQKYLPESPRFYKNKKDAQDAHEAIRPITLDRTPESLKDKIGKPYYKLYKLIYDRFLASQMADASFNSLSVEFEANKHKFKTTGRTPIFDGYTIVYANMPEDDDELNAKLPDINQGEKLTCEKLEPEQKFTKPPARYTEASLVKTMEEKGIGRPATYTQTVSVIMSRNYAEKEGKALKATELGKRVVDLLIKFFPNIMDIGFTADMENKLDDIDSGGIVWQKVVGDFWTGFEKELIAAQKDSFVDKVPDEPSDVVCDKCGAMMVYKMGKFGKFLACPNFPKCRNTKKIGQEVKLIGTCPKCGKPLKELKTKTGKVFYGCSGYPDCDYKSWDIPSPNKCPSCGSDMIEKHYKSSIVTKCTKCDYSQKENLDSKKLNDEKE